MEQKKILWIIASVGVFLLVVMGAALIINRPAQAVEPALASLQSPSDTWIMPPVTEPVSQAAAAEDPGDFQTQEQLAGESAVPDQSAGAEGNMVDTMTVYSCTTNVYGTAGTTTIDLNSLKEAVQQAAVTATNQAGAAAVASGSSGAAAQAPAAEATKPVAAAKPAASSTAKPASSTNATAKSSSTPVNQFWVQVASVTNKNNAEAARAALAANKIESEIFTHNADDGKLYYRLRVGPYITRAEAEYWKGRISLIDEFADTESYITNSMAKKQ